MIQIKDGDVDVIERIMLAIKTRVQVGAHYFNAKELKELESSAEKILQITATARRGYGSGI